MICSVYVYIGIQTYITSQRSSRATGPNAALEVIDCVASQYFYVVCFTMLSAGRERERGRERGRERERERERKKEKQVNGFYLGRLQYL